MSEHILMINVAAILNEAPKYLLSAPLSSDGFTDRAIKQEDDLDETLMRERISILRAYNTNVMGAFRESRLRTEIEFMSHNAEKNVDHLLRAEKINSPPHVNPHLYRDYFSEGQKFIRMLEILEGSQITSIDIFSSIRDRLNEWSSYFR
jgi:hypothetical protein